MRRLLRGSGEALLHDLSSGNSVEHRPTIGELGNREREVPIYSEGRVPQFGDSSCFTIAIRYGFVKFPD
jgi:hypothetical protein